MKKHLLISTQAFLLFARPWLGAGFPSANSVIPRSGNRNLRGGSYSSGAATSSTSSFSHGSSGSSYRSSSHDHYSHYGHEPKNWTSSGFFGMIGFMILTMPILFCVVLPASILMCLCSCCLYNLCCCTKDTVNSNTDYDGEEREGFIKTTDDGYSTFASRSTAPLEFEECSRRAREEVESMQTSVSQQTAPPHSGEYITSYVDRISHVQHEASLTLNFTPDFQGRGYKLSGEGCDIDGNTVIEDGHANYDGVAWWRERTITKDVGLIVLSRGTFDFARRTFNGTWLASSMEHGAYISFVAVEPPPTPTPVEPSAPDGMLYDTAFIPEATVVQVFHDDESSGAGEHSPKLR